MLPLFLACCQMRAEELQGPADTTTTPTDPSGTGTSSGTGTAPTTGTGTATPTTEEVTTAEHDSRPPTESNERKAAKPKDTAEYTAPRTKVMPAALLERLWNDSLLRQQQLKAEIEKIEAKRQPTEVVEQTPEQIEGTLKVSI